MISKLETLLRYPGTPPFIYVHHPHHAPSSLSLPEASSSIVTLDAIEYYSSRLLYSGILSRLRSPAGEVSTWDLFVRGLRDVNSGRKSKSTPGKGKRKAAVMENGHDHMDRNGAEGVVLVITHAERLRMILGPGWSVITRLSEMSGVDITLVLCSAVPWDELRPPRGDAPEPLHITVSAPTREDVLKQLSLASSHPLWPRFLDLLLSSLLHLTSSPVSELEYASQALWPIYTANLPPHAEQTQLGKPYVDSENPPEPLVLSVKLLTDLKHNLAVPLAIAAEELLTRRTGISGFKERTMRALPGTPSRTPTRHATEPGLAGDMSTCTKFLVVAAYCASYNPVKTDLRLFGRLSADGTRRRGGGFRRAGYGKTRIGKVPQRLLGPKPFTLDRLLAIFASIYTEHAPRPEDLQPVLDDWSSDEDEEDWALGSMAIAQKRAERIREGEKDRDERWEEEVDHLTMSISLWSLIPELESQGLLKRMSPVDRLDNIMLRCETAYDDVKTLAKDLKITLDEYLYEATS